MKWWDFADETPIASNWNLNRKNIFASKHSNSNYHPWIHSNPDESIFVCKQNITLCTYTYPLLWFNHSFSFSHTPNATHTHLMPLTHNHPQLFSHSSKALIAVTAIVSLLVLVVSHVECRTENCCLLFTESDLASVWLSFSLTFSMSPNKTDRLFFTRS